LFLFPFPLLEDPFSFNVPFLFRNFPRYAGPSSFFFLLTVCETPERGFIFLVVSLSTRNTLNTLNSSLHLVPLFLENRPFQALPFSLLSVTPFPPLQITCFFHPGVISFPGCSCSKGRRSSRSLPFDDCPLFMSLWQAAYAAFFFYPLTGSPRRGLSASAEVYSSFLLPPGDTWKSGLPFNKSPEFLPCSPMLLGYEPP